MPWLTCPGCFSELLSQWRLCGSVSQLYWWSLSEQKWKTEKENLQQCSRTKWIYRRDNTKVHEQVFGNEHFPRVSMTCRSCSCFEFFFIGFYLVKVHQEDSWTCMCWMYSQTAEDSDREMKVCIVCSSFTDLAFWCRWPCRHWCGNFSGTVGVKGRWWCRGCGWIKLGKCWGAGHRRQTNHFLQKVVVKKKKEKYCSTVFRTFQSVFRKQYSHASSCVDIIDHENIKFLLPVHAMETQTYVVKRVVASFHDWSLDLRGRAWRRRQGSTYTKELEYLNLMMEWKSIILLDWHCRLPH